MTTIYHTKSYKKLKHILKQYNKYPIKKKCLNNKNNQAINKDYNIKRKKYQDTNLMKN